MIQSTSNQLIERILGSFSSGFYAMHSLLQLVSIEETKSIPTAAVECKIAPRLLINPEFVRDHAETPEKLMILVMHELHHVLLGHTRLFPTATPVDNLVFDAVINALLCKMFTDDSYTSFFTDYYDDRDFPHCLLRPPRGWKPGGPFGKPPGLRNKPDEVFSVYRMLYSEVGASYDDLYDILRKLLPSRQCKKVQLLGDHSGDSTEGFLENRSPVLYEAVRAIVEKWPQPPDPIRGRSLGNLLENANVQLKRTSRRSVLRRLLARIGGEGRGRAAMPNRSESHFAVQSPIPSLDRRTAVLRGLGSKPLLFENRVRSANRGRGGERVHVYLDVSGSIGDLKGPLYGAVFDSREFVHPQVHLFSDAIHDISLSQLRKGVCKTTHGTSIDCVAEHIQKQRVRRAVLITDGFVGRPAGIHHDALANVKLGVCYQQDRSRVPADLDAVTDHAAYLEL